MLQRDRIEEEIKKIIADLGESVYGISSVERFKDVPEGFSPTDIWSECKCVIAFGTVECNICRTIFTMRYGINK